MKIIGIGNALLDVLIRLDNDHPLTESGIKKGAMDLIDELTMRRIQKAYAGLERLEAPGGSVCNTMRALARLCERTAWRNDERSESRDHLRAMPSKEELFLRSEKMQHGDWMARHGADVGYIGKIGNDTAGAVYEKEIRKAGVHPYLFVTEGLSGCSTVLISPDGERTMATFLGPAGALSNDEIPDEILQAFDCLYIEGYLIVNEKLFLPMLKRAKRMGLKVALDLSNFNIVNGFKNMLKEVIPAYVDILFSNESEANAYTGLPAIEAIDLIADTVEIAVVTVGKEGVWAKQGNRKLHDAAISNRVVDTTGAGDHFAAGFLFGYSRDATLEQSTRIGSLLSANVIETVGAQIPDACWTQIKLKIDGILRK